MRFCSLHDNPASCISLVPIFSSLTPTEMAEVAAITESKSVKKGEMIYFEGDANDKLYVVHVGLVKITQYSESGKEQVLRLLKPGEFLGEYNLFTKEPLAENAEALKDSLLCIIEGNKLRQLITKYPQIALKIIHEMSTRLVKAEILLKDVAIETAEKRVANKLLDLADECNIINLEMTKKDVAAMLGMSAETLSRQLSKLEQDGIIKQQGRKIVIRDIEYLYDII